MSVAASAGIASSLIGAIGSITSAYSEAQAQKARSAYQQGIAKINAMYAGVQAADAEQRGAFLADEVQRKSDQTISLLRMKEKAVAGAQRASFGAQGIEASGSAGDLLEDTRFLAQHEEDTLKRNAETDILTVKNNAWREAWGYQTQAMNYTAQGRMMGLAGQTESRNTLLTGGMNFLRYGAKAGYDAYQAGYFSSSDNTKYDPATDKSYEFGP